MYQRLFLSPGMFRLALAAIVGSVGPVQLPLQIFFMRDFVTFQFFLPHQPFFHEAVEDVVIEGDRHPLFGKVGIGIVGDTKEVKIGVLRYGEKSPQERMTAAETTLIFNGRSRYDSSLSTSYPSSSSGLS